MREMKTERLLEDVTMEGQHQSANRLRKTE